MSQNSISNLEALRLNGKTQVEAQRTNILDAAEKLFLQKGLENTRMSDLAAAAGITRVTLYRYFPDIHPIAFEIAVRMLQRIEAVAALAEGDGEIAYIKQAFLRMIDAFYLLRDAYRYIGMFDHLYGDHYPDETLATWYRDQIFAQGGTVMRSLGKNPTINRAQWIVTGNIVLAFLEKLASRGDLLAGEQGVALDEQLRTFKEMVSVYFEHLEGRG